ncbi:hypothetical protein [Winogradskyella aquimaris]|uniref:Uncharacterized protein n=1 Tax=Winogradskyella aquimaris TaxID=864074 RepID=A0ABU5EMA9_9FLAO|nr:hypothetical protein [Winogradskyella aquimaris]MDY2587559.1 hypothetical protein [Winogradskyella aquimaris]
MRSKLHFGFLIILLILLGKFVDNSAIPNQQIIIQFSDANISEIERAHIAEGIQLRLQNIGAENLHVDQDKKGNLIIAYYSYTNAAQIQKLLSQHDDVNYSLGINNHSKGNSEKDILRDYKLNVSDIQKNNGNDDWGFDGIQIVEYAQKGDRLNSLKKDFPNYHYQSEITNNLVKVALIIHSGPLCLEDKLTHTIPEVRAGPSV